MSKIISMAAAGPVWQKPAGRSRFGSILSGFCRKRSRCMPWDWRNSRGDTGLEVVARG